MGVAAGRLRHQQLGSFRDNELQLTETLAGVVTSIFRLPAVVQRKPGLIAVAASFLGVALGLPAWGVSAGAWPGTPLPTVIRNLAVS